MDIKFTEEQNLIRQSARHFFTDKCPSSFVREMASDEKGYTEEFWHGMADLGFMGLIFPEEYGGTGGNFLDLVLLVEEMGRACVPGPFFSSVILGGLNILEAGNERQKREWLTKIATGEIIVTLALTESDNAYDPSSISVTATPKRGSYIINGTKLFVPEAHVADYLLCAARTRDKGVSGDGITLFIAESESKGVIRNLLGTIVGDKQYEVIFNGVEVPTEKILGDIDQGWVYIKKVLQKAAVAKCAEMVGGAQQVLDMTVPYAKKREQFGKPIGSFQAIQHHCANMLVDLEACRWVTYKTAWMIGEGIPCDRQVSIAKAWCNEAYRKIVALGHQVIGGVGFCEEHDLPLYFRRARMAEVLFGDADFHRKIVADHIFSKEIE